MEAEILDAIELMWLIIPDACFETNVWQGCLTRMSRHLNWQYIIHRITTLYPTPSNVRQMDTLHNLYDPFTGNFPSIQISCSLKCVDHKMTLQLRH